MLDVGIIQYLTSGLVGSNVLIIIIIDLGWRKEGWRIVVVLQYG